MRGRRLLDVWKSSRDLVRQIMCTRVRAVSCLATSLEEASRRMCIFAATALDACCKTTWYDGYLSARVVAAACLAACLAHPKEMSDFSQFV
jgi:hypothetical protein